MTGYRSEHYRHRCAEGGCELLSLPSWDDLLTVFPRGIRPTDIDGMVEVGGRFLFLEEKGPRVPIPTGQRRALAALGSQPNTTVLVFRPLDLAGHLLEVLRFPDPRGFQTITREAFRSSLAAWARRADEGTTP